MISLQITGPQGIGFLTEVFSSSTKNQFCINDNDKHTKNGVLYVFENAFSSFTP